MGNSKKNKLTLNFTENVRSEGVKDKRRDGGVKGSQERRRMLDDQYLLEIYFVGRKEETNSVPSK